MVRAIQKVTTVRMLTSQLRNCADEIVSEKTIDGVLVPITRLEELCNMVWIEALAGKRWATELIFTRLEGRIPNADEIEKGNQPAVDAIAGLVAVLDKAKEEDSFSEKE